jgi:hypothetical protein
MSTTKNENATGDREPIASNASPTSELLSPSSRLAAPVSVPPPLASSINAMLRTMPASPSSSGLAGISVSIAGVSDSLSSSNHLGAVGIPTESDRTAALRAKGASLVQQVMMNKERLSATAKSSPLVRQSTDELPVFVPVDCGEPGSVELIADEHCAELQHSVHESGEVGETPFDSAIESLQIAESHLSELLSSNAPDLEPPDHPVDEVPSNSTIASTNEPVSRTESLANAALSAAPVAKSHSVSPADQKPAPQGAALDLDGLYVAITAGRNRRDATARMVDWIAKTLPGTHVRCGLGTSRLRRFIDARLGWLGSESSLQRAMAGQWRAQLIDSAESSYDDGSITIRLNRPGFNELGLLTIEGGQVNEELFRVFQRHEKAIAAILWGRPRLVLPEWSASKGRPRVAIIAAAVMLLLLLICPVPYPASCSVLVEPVGSRVVSAPFEAMLESVAVEPGDEVKMGQSLAALDGRPLRLEQQSIDAEIQQATKQQDVAIAAGRIAEAQLAQLKCQQLRRQRELLERRLNQLNIISPIEGVIVAGDLRRSIGVPLEAGQVLFEVAPLDRVVLEVEIPESEIGLVNDDSPVQLRVESARVGNVDATLTKIYPMAQLREEKSVFVAPIEVDNQSRQYRPGMRGRATVFGPVRPWVWRHIRGFVEQVAWLARW